MPVNIYLDKEVEELAKDRAKSLFKSFSGYVRDLIVEDLQEAQIINSKKGKKNY